MKTYFVMGLGLVFACMLAMVLSPTYFAWVASPDGWQAIYSQIVGASSDGTIMAKSVGFSGSHDLATLAFYVGCIGLGIMISAGLFWATYGTLLLVGAAGIAYAAWNLILYIGIPAAIIFIIVRAIDYFFGSKIVAAADKLVEPVAEKLTAATAAIAAIVGLKPIKPKTE